MLVQLTAGVLASGLLLSLPAFVTVVLLNLLLGVVGRAAPQINPLSLGLGAGPMLAVAVTALTLPILGVLLANLLQSSLQNLPAVFRLLGP